MKKLEYTVRFITPAFLGNAEQAGQWRTPPFKALLRQWWRVAYAADHNFDVNVADMRQEEGKLFGNAWLLRREGNREVADHSKSLVLIRLDGIDANRTNIWRLGSQQGVAPLPTDISTSYAWFGLKRAPAQPDKSGIKPNEGEGQRLLRIAYPEQHETRISMAIRLIHAFGQAGSRSRGGWGSFDLHEVKPLNAKELASLARPIVQCLAHDWAMSLARDQRGLCIWYSRNSYPSWDKAMRALASERRTVRTALKTARDDLRPALGFAGAGRMPSPLRWKVISNSQGQLSIRVFAMPHRIPVDSEKTMIPERMQRAWATVFNVLDASNTVARLSE